MPTIAERLQSLVTIQSNVMSTLADKGVNMVGISNFAEFATELPNMSFGGGGGGGDLLDAFENGWAAHIDEISGATKIPSSMFSYCYSLLTEVSFPSASYIGNDAFYNCASLSTIDFPNATYIGNGAFGECKSLNIASFPNATYIGENAFYYCTSLSTISFPNATYIGSSAFRLCGKITFASFPNVSYVGDNAFYNCNSMSTIDFPNTTYVGNSAFYNCRSITSVNIPNVSYIGSGAFYYCSILTEVNFPNATHIGTSAFHFCKSLTSVGLSSTIEYIGHNAFFSCTQLDLTQIATLVTSDYSWFTNALSFINPSEFSDKWNIRNGQLYSTASTLNAFPSDTFYRYHKLGDLAFNNLSDMLSVLKPYLSGAPITYVGAKAFYNNSNIAQTFLNLDLCSYIGDLAFGAMYSKAVNGAGYNITGSARIGYLGDNGLENCKYIGSSAFAAAQMGLSLNLINCEYIGYGAFAGGNMSYDGSYFTGVGNLSKCKYIGSKAFATCTRITTIGNLDSCEFIGENAFSGCTQLKSVYFTNTTMIKTDGYNVFSNTLLANGYGSIYVPASLLSEYKNDKYWSVYSGMFSAIVE